MPRYQETELAARPRLNRGLALNRQLMFAMRPGWEKGARAPMTGAGVHGIIDDVKGARGDFTGTADPTMYPQYDGNRAFDEGPGASSIRVAWTNVLSRWNVTRGVTAACLIRPSFIFNNEEAIFCHQDGPAPNQGWGITASFAGDPNPNGYHFQVNDGAVREISFTNTQNTARTAFLVLRFDGASLDAFMNGAFLGTVAGGGAPIVNATTHPLEMFGDGTQPNFCTKLSMAAFWNRSLRGTEIQRLNADPYMLWRAPDFDMGADFPGEEGGNDCCCPCCGSFYYFGL